MSTDYELLVLAAKAAGMVLADYQDGKNGLWMARGYFQPGTNSRDWNPLEDDGDALRLAVRLKLCISQWSDDTACVGYPKGSNDGGNWFEQSGNGDILAATRRAIVRAAAEIGRAMP